MARIERPRGRSAPGFVSTVPGQVAVPDFLAPVAQGLGQIADVMAHSAAQAREEADRVEFARRTTDFELEVNTELDQAIESYDGASPGFYDGQLERYDQRMAQALEDAPERLRPALEARFQGTPRARYGVAAADAENAATRAYSNRSIVQTVERTQNSILSSPASYRGALETVEDLAAGVPAAIRADFIEATEETYTAAYLSARLREDPYGLRAELNGGDLDDVVDPSNKDSFLSSAETEIRRREREQQTAANQAANAAEAAVRHALDDAEDALENGLAPATSFAEILTRADGIGTADGAELAARAREGQLLTEFSHQFSRLPLADAERLLREERESLSDGATGLEARRVALGERMLGTMATRLRDDPVAYAGTLGFDVGRLDMTSVDGLRDSLPRRRSQAAGVSRHFGVPGRILTDAEVTAIGAGIEAGSLARPGVAAAVVETMGDDAPAVLAEIAPQEPMLAHMGGLVLEGAGAAARDLDRGLELRRADGFSTRLAPAARLQEIADTELGGFAGRHGGTALRIQEAANAIYEARALRHGWDRDDFNANEYRRALNEATGATFVNGVQFGGLTQFGSSAARRLSDPLTSVPGGGLFIDEAAPRHKVVVPGWLRADRFDDVVDMIADRTLENPQVLMYDAQGGDIPREALSRALLQSIGDGRYLVTFGRDGQYQALNNGGTPYVLDLSSWEDAIARARPNWVRR